MGLFVLLIVVTVGAVTYSFHQRSSEAALGLSEQLLRESADHMDDITSEYFRQVENNLALAATLLQFRDLVRDEEEILTLIWHIIRQSDTYATGYVADTKGNFLQARNVPNLTTRVIHADRPGRSEQIHRNPDFSVLARYEREDQFDPRQRPWFTNVTARPESYWTDVYHFSSSGSLGVTGSFPVLRDGQVIAVVGLDITLDGLSQFITEQELSRKGALLLLNGQDEVVALPNNLLNYSGEAAATGVNHISQLGDGTIGSVYSALQQRQESGHDATEHLVAINGSNYFATHQPLSIASLPGWALLIVLPEDAILAEVNKNMMNALVMALILMVVAVYLVYLIASQLSVPILRLANNTERLSQLRFNELQPVKSRFKEIRMMSDQMVQMRDSMLAFDKYVPTDLVRQIVTENHPIQLGGEARQLTMFVTEIGGFSNIAAQLSPAQQAAYIIRYQGQIARVLLHEQATINNYVGDMVSAFWGAPRPNPDGAQAACRAALACCEALHELNRQLRSEGLPPLQNRIGIVYGEGIVGNFGSEERMIYSVIGECVNDSTQLEGLNKQYGTDIIINDALYQQVHQSFLCRLLDLLPNSDGTLRPIYELVDWYDSNDRAARQLLIADYEQAVRLLREQQDVAAARPLLERLAADDIADPPSQWLLQQINAAAGQGV